MKNRFFALVLVLGMLLSLSAVPAFAADSEDEALRTVRALGILVGDENGNLDLTANVTRAQFAKMMVVASTYSDSVGLGTGGSLYKDVKSGHWASEYIRLAVSAGWFVGYSDGTFRPDNTITLEEACTATLRLLGYDASAMAGAYPTAQLSKAAAIGLRDGLNAEKGLKLTRAQCVTLFYNLMTCTNNSNQIYAQTLGYTVTNGKLDYGELVEANLSGPYISDGTIPVLPITGSMAVYRNGTEAELSDISQYDVYYYNTYLRTVWIYSDRASGTITGVSPNTVLPTAVTVAGVSYELSSSDASYALSDMGSFTEGDVVTLLLGMDGGVVSVLSTADSAATYYGAVLSSTKEADSSDSASIRVSVRVACADGAIRTFSVASGSFSEGDVVVASVSDGGVSVKRVTAKSLSGSFNSAGTTFAGYTLASDIEILDIADNGAYASAFTSRLAGMTLSSDDVLYWALDEHGELCCLILEDATGDLWTYGILTSVTNSSMSTTSASGRYSYVCDGESGSLSTNGSQFAVKEGGAAFLYSSDGTLSTIKNLVNVTVTELSSRYIRASSKKYLMAEDVQVYLLKNGSYYQTTLSAVDLDNYSLTAWYDAFGCSAGGLVRVLVAVAK